ncbi:MAG: pilus assembly protein, partial [Alphaproteobacteria bacterium]|nr:pilus assembly protein [Alphaproteobacteria bacterium]
MLKVLQKWKLQDDGSTAIEFALTALPVIMLLIGIIEIS